MLSVGQVSGASFNTGGIGTLSEPPTTGSVSATIARAGIPPPEQAAATPAGVAASAGRNLGNEGSNTGGFLAAILNGSSGIAKIGENLKGVVDWVLGTPATRIVPAPPAAASTPAAAAKKEEEKPVDPKKADENKAYTSKEHINDLRTFNKEKADWIKDGKAADDLRKNGEVIDAKDLGPDGKAKTSAPATNPEPGTPSDSSAAMADAERKAKMDEALAKVENSLWTGEPITGQENAQPTESPAPAEVAPPPAASDLATKFFREEI